MNGPVDVCGVIRAVIEEMRANGNTGHVENLMAADAAVTELIEADKEYDAAIATAKDLNRKIAEQGWFEVEFDALRKSGDRVVVAQMRRAQALAGIGGAK